MVRRRCCSFTICNQNYNFELVLIPAGLDSWLVMIFWSCCPFRALSSNSFSRIVHVLDFDLHVTKLGFKRHCTLKNNQLGHLQLDIFLALASDPAVNLKHNCPTCRTETDHHDQLGGFLFWWKLNFNFTGFQVVFRIFFVFALRLFFTPSVIDCVLRGNLHWDNLKQPKNHFCVVERWFWVVECKFLGHFSIEIKFSQ